MMHGAYSVKLILSVILYVRYHPVKMQGSVNVLLNTLLNFAVDGDEWQAAPSDCLKISYYYLHYVNGRLLVVQRR